MKGEPVTDPTMPHPLRGTIHEERRETQTCLRGRPNSFQVKRLPNFGAGRMENMSAVVGYKVMPTNQLEQLYGIPWHSMAFHGIPTETLCRPCQLAMPIGLASLPPSQCDLPRDDHFRQLKVPNVLAMSRMESHLSCWWGRRPKRPHTRGQATPPARDSNSSKMREFRVHASRRLCSGLARRAPGQELQRLKFDTLKSPH